MSLYHFCAPQFLNGIQKHGLVLGCTPVMIGGKLAFMKGTQWLTTNGSFDQPWNGRISVKYDRCAFRLDINIPEDMRKYLWTWQKLKGRLLVQHGMDCIIDGFDIPEYSHSEDWRIYFGVVEPEWIGEVTPRPGGPNSDLKEAKALEDKNV